MCYDVGVVMFLCRVLWFAQNTKFFTPSICIMHEFHDYAVRGCVSGRVMLMPCVRTVWRGMARWIPSPLVELTFSAWIGGWFGITKCS
jgi:hypothetical protein